MKRIFIIILLVVFAAFGISGLSATVASAEEMSATLLTVYGNGAVQLEPDIAYINLGVITDGTDLKSTQNENSAAMKTVMEALKQVGIKEGEIKTAAYNIYPQYDNQSNLTGYKIRNDVSVTVTDVDSVGLVLEAAVKAGVNSTGSISFGSSKESEAYQDALAQGVTDAKAKAEALAKAAGMHIASVYSLTEGYSNAPVLARSNTYFEADSLSSVPIEAGTLSVSATVTIVYELK